MYFSIVIIALNEEKYIGTLLNCLKKQTFKNFEVIVVDGKSEDKTVEVVNRYKDDFELRVVIAEERGTGNQRNMGARLSLYDNIIFFDADVSINNDFIEQFASFLIENSVDCLTGLYKPLESTIYNHWSMFVHNMYIRLREHIGPVATGAFMYVKKDVFLDCGGFDTGIIYGEDSDLVYRMWKKGNKFVVLKNPKVYFSCRRLKKEGSLKHTFWLIKTQFEMLFGKKFNDSKKVRYKFGHYDKD